MPRLMTALALIVGFLLAGPAARAAELLVVIDATNAGADLQPGQMVGLEDAISLPAGARLSLLNRQGRMVLVKGPFDAPLSQAVQAAGDAADPGVMQKIGDLMKGDDSIVSFGAARAIATREHVIPPSATLISVMADGQRCLISRKPQLWRSDAKATARLTLTGPGGRKETLQWPAGADRIALPPAFIADRSIVTADMGSSEVTITLNLLPADKRNLAQILAWLGERHCLGQAAALVKDLRAEARRVE